MIQCQDINMEHSNYEIDDCDHSHKVDLNVFIYDQYVVVMVIDMMMLMMMMMMMLVMMMTHLVIEICRDATSLSSLSSPSS